MFPKHSLTANKFHRTLQNLSPFSSPLKRNKFAYASQRWFSYRSCNIQNQIGSYNPLNKNRASIFKSSLPACHYAVQNIFRLTENSASQLQPFLDIKNVIKREDELQDSINKRQLARKQVKRVKELYEKAQEYKIRKEAVQELREETTTRCQQLMRQESNSPEKNQEVKDLKEKGRILREKIREAENKFNEINDQLVDLVISMPNILDKETPVEVAKFLKEVTPPKHKLWTHPEYTAVETQCAPGMLAEFAVGKTAWMDIDLRGRAQAHLLKEGYIETGNADLVRRIVLQGAGIERSQFLRIREPQVKKGMEHTTYLVGGASFPSYLALFAQSIIEDSTILPLRYFVIGRSYQSQKTKPGFYQSHGVQVLVACKSETELEEEAQRLQNVMESFYSNKVGFAFQTQLVPAPRLQMYEKKKLAFVTKETENSPSKVIGTISTVGDYVSKRLLCCYFDSKKKVQFLHLLTAKFFDITHFLRSSNPKLLTHADLLSSLHQPKPEMLNLEFGEEVFNTNNNDKKTADGDKRLS